MIKKLLFPTVMLAAAISLISMVSAQGKSTTLTGVLIDKACAGKAAKSANPQEAAANFGKDCALSEGCAKSGFGVFADGKFYQFDEKGAEQAKSALQKTKKSKGSTFKVTGSVAGDKMTVENIAEVE